MQMTRMAQRSRLAVAAICAALLLWGCAGDDKASGGAQPAVYNDWLYHHYHWYDDDYWIWADEHPDCCDDEDDIRDSLRTWYDGLDPDEQQKVQDRAKEWMEEHGIEPTAGQSAKDLVLDTAAERWAALTPAERQQWRDDRRARIEQRRAAGAQGLTAEQRAELSARAADLDPDQRAALLESARGTSLDGASERRTQRSISNHPTPRRSGLSAGGTRFQGARGGGRGGRRR
jgi:hypothetical protein